MYSSSSSISDSDFEIIGHEDLVLEPSISRKFPVLYEDDPKIVPKIQGKLTADQRKCKEALLIAEMEDLERMGYLGEQELFKFKSLLTGTWKLKFPQNRQNLQNFLAHLDPLESVLFQAAQKNFKFGRNAIRIYDKLNSSKLNEHIFEFGEPWIFEHFGAFAYFCRDGRKLKLKIVYVKNFDAAKAKIFKSEEFSLNFDDTENLQITTELTEHKTKVTRIYEKIINRDQNQVQNLLFQLKSAHIKIAKHENRIKTLKTRLRPFEPIEHSLCGVWHSLRPLPPQTIEITVTHGKLEIIQIGDSPSSPFIIEFDKEIEDVLDNSIHFTYKKDNQIVTKTINRSNGKEKRRWTRSIGLDGNLRMVLEEFGKVKEIREYEKVSEVLSC